MNIEKWIIAHFSPTGGTKRVADAIAAGFSVPVAQMDLTKADSAVALGEHDGLMAVLPVFAGRVPQIALERLYAIKGRGHKAVAVVVYGNREFDDGLLETKNALETQGFSVIAAAAFIAEHSIVRSVAAGRPDPEDEKIARQFGADIMGSIVVNQVTVNDGFPVRIIKNRLSSESLFFFLNYQLHMYYLRMLYFLRS